MTTSGAPKKLVNDVVRELVALLVEHPIDSPGVQAKIDELTSVSRGNGQLPPYDIGLAAAKDALKRVFSQLLSNLPLNERCRLEDRFESAFEQEFRRLAPDIKVR